MSGRRQMPLNGWRGARHRTTGGVAGVMKGGSAPIAIDPSREQTALMPMSRTDRLLTAVIAIALISKLFFAFRINVHWDEFYFLSMVHDYLRGALESRLQTFHVHLFSWLALLPGDEIDQIIAGRLVMACLAIGSAGLIYAICRHFVARGAAQFAVLAYLSLNFVLQHGASFRADPIPTFLVLLAVHGALRRPERAAAALIAGAALGFATLVSIKTAVYYPVVAAVIWCAPTPLRARLLFGGLAALAFVAIFGPLYLLHDASLAAPATVAVGERLNQTASRMLFQEGLLPRMTDFLWVLSINALFWYLALGGVIIAVCRALTGGGRASWLPLALALPLLSPIVYRNAFAYYYAFAVPTSCVLVALMFDALRRSAATRRSLPVVLALWLLIAVQLVILALLGGFNAGDEITPQRRVLNAVHQVFPQPTSYIDGFGVVATSPRHSFFMSTWGLQNYRDVGKPVFPALVADGQPPMLLADSASLYAALFPGVVVRTERELLPEDQQFLRENYLQHWDLLFVAGKKLLPPAPDGRMTFQVAIAGDYRLESPREVELDGVRVPAGGIIRLGIGEHRLVADQSLAPVILRWSAAGPAPDLPPVGLNGFFGRSKLILSGGPPAQDGD